MNEPLVSAVIAVYNGAKTVSQALDSITAQTYKNIEVICVEDGSKDNTYAVIQEWQSKHPTVSMSIVKNEKNSGLAASLNRGIAAANGQYIARIDADDQWLPDKIEKQITYLLAHPEVGMIGSFYMNERSGHKTYIRLPQTDKDIKKTMFKKNPFGHSCVIFKQELVLSVGGYNGSLREDRDLWFRLLHKTNFYNIPEYLVLRNIDSSHFTSSKELRRNILTVHTYIQAYKKSPITYIWLLEPIAVYIYHAFKKYVTR